MYRVKWGSIWKMTKYNTPVFKYYLIPKFQGYKYRFQIPVTVRYLKCLNTWVFKYLTTLQLTNYQPVIKNASTVICEYQKWKKRSVISKHCALAVVWRQSQKFSPRCRPFPRAQDGQNLISWRWSLSLPTDRVWWRSMHAISSYRGNRPTNAQTHRQDRLQYTAPQLARSTCNNMSRNARKCQSIRTIDLYNT